jgi:WD40 repeat protein
VGTWRGVAGTQFSPDGKTAITTSDDGSARLWEVASGRELRVLHGHEAPVVSAQFSADGQASADHQSGRDRASLGCGQRRELRVLRGHHGAVLSGQFPAMA